MLKKQIRSLFNEGGAAPSPLRGISGLKIVATLLRCCRAIATHFYQESAG
jgi:hypothetical protein